MKPEFFQLSEEERRQFMIRDGANLDAPGMKAISMAAGRPGRAPLR
ncbi:hypothetical protein QQF73_00085 [Marinobacter sp. M216]|uniref:Uncharacterized protein n=1 Tax=Marinobacter albus TaxID=3030833 RepID=A0ABT7H8Z0_9GAMM|nr:MULTISPECIES: hypothetical protein [unclassified Marinobacter]MBW7471680.1 hypothetical protein [Marinobacter sp. F4218]MDK9556000.1 hypothetical protein [Marinobacter sp. M216]